MATVPESEWEAPFRAAHDAVRGGDFDEVKKSLREGLGFTFVATTDSNHWMYYHSELRSDPHFRYPRNLYRPHGSRRSADRISRHDQSQARQMIEALKAVRASAQAGKESDQ